MNETDEELFAKARAHMEKYSIAASLDRRLWDATVRLALRSTRPEAVSRNDTIEECAKIAESWRFVMHGPDEIAAEIRSLKRHEPQEQRS